MSGRDTTKKLSKGKASKALIAGALSLVSSLTCAPSFANRPSDYISTNGKTSAQPQAKRPDAIPDPKIGKQGAMAIGSDRTPTVTWFETLDDLKWTMRISEEDRVILKRPLQQELERVQDWMRSAARVSKNYRMLAKEMRSLSVPESAHGVKTFRDLHAEWYDDVALVYEDLIRPRPRARTKEELESTLKEIDDRAQMLKESGKELMAMDMDLRRQHRIHADRHIDALSQYVFGK